MLKTLWLKSQLKKPCIVGSMKRPVSFVIGLKWKALFNLECSDHGAPQVGRRKQGEVREPPSQGKILDRVSQIILARSAVGKC